MLQIFVNANYDFVGKRRWFYLVSGGFMLLSIASIVFRGGLNYGIDFTGGTLVQVRYDKLASVEIVRRGLDEIKLGGAVIQQFGDAQEYLIRLHQAGVGSAVDQHVLPRHEPRLLRAEKGHHGSEVVGVAEHAHRVHRPLGAQRLLERGALGDRARLRSLAHPVRVVGPG